jgi:hypothetical protein
MLCSFIFLIFTTHLEVIFIFVILRHPAHKFYVRDNEGSQVLYQTLPWQKKIPSPAFEIPHPKNRDSPKGIPLEGMTIRVVGKISPKESLGQLLNTFLTIK